MNRSICLNADIGELPGEAGRALDGEILKVVSRCSIACGGHAGDAESMATTLRMASDCGVLSGAHPSYPDREGFGRSRMGLSIEVIERSLLTQVRQLLDVALATGVSISFIKPHGALYNDAAKDSVLAMLVASACHETGIPTLIGPPGSEMENAAARAGLDYLREGFADRAYEADGSLTPRGLPGAVITDHDTQADQALGMILHRRVITRTGEAISLDVETICLHGDTPGAADNAARLRKVLEAQGIDIRP